MSVVRYGKFSLPNEHAVKKQQHRDIFLVKRDRVYTVSNYKHLLKNKSWLDLLTGWF